MAHKVIFTLPDREIHRADIEFLVKKSVKGSEEVIGRLLVSQGAVVWRPKNKQRGTKLTWKQFGDLMESGQPE